MKILIAITFAILALSEADVSHLTKKYLPPVQQQQLPVPSVSYHQQTITQQTAQPLKEYLPPVHAPNYPASAPQSVAVPVAIDATYGAPALSEPSLISVSSGQTVHETYSPPASEYLPPAQQINSVASLEPAYTGAALQNTHSIVFSGKAPAPIGAPINAPIGTAFGQIDNAGTQYALNGGYVYRKK